jgi:hypothetical protein
VEWGLDAPQYPEKLLNVSFILAQICVCPFSPITAQHGQEFTFCVCPQPLYTRKDVEGDGRDEEELPGNDTSDPCS